jgi:hypothetical protein
MIGAIVQQATSAGIAAGASVVSGIYRNHVARYADDLGAMYIEVARHSFGEAGAWGAAFLARGIALDLRGALNQDASYVQHAQLIASSKAIGARLGRKLVAAARAFNAAT